MPKLTLDNSYRFCSQEETISYFHSKSIETLLQKLTSDWFRQFALEEHIQADLIGWKKMLVKSNEVLGHAVEKQTTNQSVKMWLCKLQNLACDVEYLLDEFQMESFQRKLMLDDDAVDESDSIAMSKIKEVNARLQDSASQIDPLGLKESSGGKFRNVRLRLPTVPLVSGANVLAMIFKWKPVIELTEIVANWCRFFPLISMCVCSFFLFFYPKLFLAAVRRVGRDPGPAIFSPLIKKAKDLAVLEKKCGLASLEKIGSGGCGEVYKAEDKMEG